MKKITAALTGDSFITRKLPEGDESVQQVAAIIGQADVRFTNLEVTLHNMEGFPSAQSGGTWAVAQPDVLQDLKRYGFNLVAWANNHTMDYSYGGLEATSRYLDQHGIIHTGVGNNLAEASEIKYMECKGGRVAMIAATATFHDSWLAGEQRPDSAGRPGINPLRYTTTYTIKPERMEQLRAIAEMTGINQELELSIKEGFALEGDPAVFSFGQYRFTTDEAEGRMTRPDRRDMLRMLKAIREAKRQSDCILVSIHAHEMKHGRKELPADFLTEFARACIDEGAHAIIGHGPHIVRGIEIYKQSPIFYSLGNFIFQSESVSRLPADYYEKYGLGHDHNTADALDARTANDTRGLGTNPKVWSSVIASLTIEDGLVQGFELHPISLGYGEPRYRRGWPQMTNDSAVLHEIQQLSREFGTELTIKAGKAEWKRP